MDVSGKPLAEFRTPYGMRTIVSELMSFILYTLNGSPSTHSRRVYVFGTTALSASSNLLLSDLIDGDPPKEIVITEVVCND